MVIFKISKLAGHVRPKKKLFVSCNPTLTSFYSKKSLLQSFFRPPNSQSTKNMHKTHIFDQKNNEKKNLLPTYLPYFFSDRYRKQTISFFKPNDKRRFFIVLALSGEALYKPSYWFPGTAAHLEWIDMKHSAAEPADRRTEADRLAQPAWFVL